MTRTTGRLTLIGVTDVLALVLLRPDIGDLTRDVSSPGARLDSIGSDQVLVEVVGAALWLLAAWVAVGLLALVGARLPGALGRIARRVARIAVPRAIAALLAGSAGLGVLLAPVAASAVPSPVWPSAPASQSSSSHVPAPAWPSSAAPQAKPAETPGRPTSTPPAPAPERVKPGDSLWLLAAHRLGTDATSAQISEYWPQVYAANRAVVGADPSLIIPGQRLIEPAPTAQESTP